MLDLSKYNTLFLDRDGVINKRIPGDYIKTVAEFEFLPGVLDAIVQFSQQFKYIIVVTNQAGIGKGQMTLASLHKVHHHMLIEVEKAGGRIDAIYFCPELHDHNPICRKPNTGMAWLAKTNFPDIEFHSSIMVGDSHSDMLFGQRLGMATVLVEGKEEEQEILQKIDVDVRCKDLRTLVELLFYI